ncbi:MAG: hypothetical protein Harvfovirus19_1 [Harvfovirus sp.]|uniref:Uncharacterized protein n=1 Tax=Harvfovirus sp. TaxID=2487768 RepID=A0A3G5A1Q0_9VIRU|nr:MAG: hypothetical protein Harvfovirus19_1 [Harvfovirus sp.]
MADYADGKEIKGAIAPFTKTLLHLASLSASAIIRLIKSLSGMPYYSRKWGELELKHAIKNLPTEKGNRIINWLANSNHSLALAFYGRHLFVDSRSMGAVLRISPIDSDHSENIQPWSTAYKLGERFYSPMAMVHYYIGYMWEYNNKHLAHFAKGHGPIFNATEWKDQAGDLTIEKVVGLLIQSCEAGNPEAIRMYIYYLQNDLKDYGKAREWILRLVSLGEQDSLAESSYSTDRFLNSFQPYFDNSELVSMETTGSITELVIALYCTVENLLVRNVIQRENEITLWRRVADQFDDSRVDPHRSMEKFTRHYDLLVSTLHQILDHHCELAVPLLMKHLTNEQVFPIVSFILGSHLSNRPEEDEKGTSKKWTYAIKDEDKAYELIIKSARTGYHPALAYVTCDPDQHCFDRQSALSRRFIKDLQSIRI